MKRRLLGHTAYLTEYHIVWVTKYRKPVLNSVRKRYLAGLFPKILPTMKGCEVIEYNILADHLADHVHTVMVVPPKYAISEVVGRIKGMSSSLLRKRFRKLEKVIEYVRNQ